MARTHCNDSPAGPAEKADVDPEQDSHDWRSLRSVAGRIAGRLPASMVETPAGRDLREA